MTYGHDVHRAALHRAVEELAELRVRLVGRHPVVRRARLVLGRRADEREVLDARDVVRVASGAGSSPGSFSWLSGIEDALARPPARSAARFSSSEPSHHTMRSGLVRRAISSTHARRVGFLVGAAVEEDVGRFEGVYRARAHLDCILRQGFGGRRRAAHVTQEARADTGHRARSRAPSQQAARTRVVPRARVDAGQFQASRDGKASRAAAEKSGTPR